MFTVVLALLTPAVLAAPLVYAFNQLGQNLVASLSLHLHPRFHLGDTVEIESGSGEVVHLGWFSVVLTNNDNALTTVPSSKFQTDIYTVHPGVSREK
ncbi:MAG: hypothetical protein NVSMB52_03570 [Chloroflexota bacterium]